MGGTGAGGLLQRPDRSEKAASRTVRQEPEGGGTDPHSVEKKGLRGIFVDNRGKGAPDTWKTLCILYNRKEKPVSVPLEGDGWEVLADGKDSFLWKNPEKIRKEAQAGPVSILMLGKR